MLVERLGKQHYAENYDFGSGDLICPASACELEYRDQSLLFLRGRA